MQHLTEDLLALAPPHRHQSLFRLTEGLVGGVQTALLVEKLLRPRTCLDLGVTVV
jgi:hypothetical protein